VSDRSSNHIDQSKQLKEKIIGLVPAAGKAFRISPLPLSKELYPIGFYQMDNGGNLHPKPVCLNLLESMQVAKVTEAFIVLRKGKWDIPAYLGDGKNLNMNLGYLIMDLPYGVPFSLDQAFPFIQDATVVFGFPDIIFQPYDAFLRLLAKQAECNADVVLGLFPAENPQKMDMVAFDESGNVSRIEIKPTETDLKYTWIIAVWNDSFTRFMHDFVSHDQEKRLAGSMDQYRASDKEIHVGDVIQSALDSDLIIEDVIFEKGSYIDIGTPEEMIRAIKMYMHVNHLP
jgi:glucose-1-phosphate thymidylyltransferase